MTRNHSLCEQMKAISCFLCHRQAKPLQKDMPHGSMTHDHLNGNDADSLPRGSKNNIYPRGSLERTLWIHFHYTVVVEEGSLWWSAIIPTQLNSIIPFFYPKTTSGLFHCTPVSCNVYWGFLAKLWNIPKENWYSNHPFAGAKMLVSWRV